MRTRVLQATAGVALTLVLTSGCGGDEATDGPDGPDPSVSTSTAQADATEEESAFGADAATGRKVTLPEVSYRLPQDIRWLRTRDGASASSLDGLRIVFNMSYSSEDPEEAVRIAIRNSNWSGPTEPAEQERRVVDGVEGYVLEAVDRRGFFYEYGIVQPGGDNWYFTFEMPDDGPYYRDLVESVLASVTWN